MRALVRSACGYLKKVVTHAMTNVFCREDYRGKGYAGRLMEEMGKVLPNHQFRADIPGEKESRFSILWSDVGKDFYAKYGWKAFPSTQLVFKQANLSSCQPDSRLDNSRGYGQLPSYFAQCATTSRLGSLLLATFRSIYSAFRFLDIHYNGDYVHHVNTSVPIRLHTKLLHSRDLARICAWDERLMLKRMRSFQDVKTRVAIVPDHAMISWHMARDDFVAKALFDKVPQVKGAVTGPRGRRVCVIWRRNYTTTVDQTREGTCSIF